MGFSGLEWLILLTLILIVFWVISLGISRNYTPLLITSILLLLFGLMWFFTTPVAGAVMFGMSASLVLSSIAYISLALGVFGFFLVVKG